MYYKQVSIPLQVVLVIESPLDQASSSPNRPTSSPITVLDCISCNAGQASQSPDLFVGTRTTRPLSSQSDDVTSASSALSGTTLARALMANSFILSADRSSTGCGGIGAGLTRSDSTTLPRWECSSSASFYNDSGRLEAVNKAWMEIDSDFGIDE